MTICGGIMTIEEQLRQVTQQRVRETEVQNKQNHNITVL